MISRRSIIGTLIFSATKVYAAKPSVPQVLARDVRNGWGVCGRPGIDGSIDTYARMLTQIGTSDIRLYLGLYGTSASDRMRALGQAMQASGMDSAGPKITSLVTAYLNDGTTWLQQQGQIVAFARSGMLRAIEGPNEMNNRMGNGSHGPNDRIAQNEYATYPTNYFAWAKVIKDFARTNRAALKDALIIAPCIATGRQVDYANLPDVSDYVDAGNMHFYAGRGYQPNLAMGYHPSVGYFNNIRLWAQAAQAPKKPVWMTECGATTSSDYVANGILAYNRDGISQAKYLANQLLDYFAAGGQRMFIYNTIDGSGRFDDAESNFGLFHHDGSPKPAAMMLSRLKHLLSLGCYEDKRNLTDTGMFVPAFNAQALTITGLVTPGQAGPGYLVMPKSDGSTMIAVWNESVIDDGKGQAVTATDNRVSIDFGSTQTYTVHDLIDASLMTVSKPQVLRSDTGRNTNITLRGYPILIELHPG